MTISGAKYDPEKVHPELKEAIKGYEECMLYFHINTAGGVSFKVRHNAMQPDRLQQISIPDAMTVAEEMFHEQRFCMEQLEEKGYVKEPVNADGEATDEYWKWFRAWHDYVEDLPPAEWRAFEAALNAQRDVSKWRPEGL